MYMQLQKNLMTIHANEAQTEMRYAAKVKAIGETHDKIEESCLLNLLWTPCLYPQATKRMDE